LIRELLLQWLDLHHDLAPELTRDPELRQGFHRFLRGSAGNVSALPAGVLQVLLAQVVGRESPEALRSLVSGLDEEEWPELRRFPNTEVVNAFDGTTALTPAAGTLSDRMAALRAQRDQARAQAEALRELARLRQRLLRSKWAALGSALGLLRGIGSDEGRTPEEKLAALKSAVGRSVWLRIGRVN
jgi:hypothetical protein